MEYKSSYGIESQIFSEFDQIQSNLFITQLNSAFLSNSADSVSPNLCTIWGFPVLLFIASRYPWTG